MSWKKNSFSSFSLFVYEYIWSQWWKILTNKKGYSCIVNFYHTVALSYPQLHLTESFQGSRRTKKLSLMQIAISSLQIWYHMWKFCRKQSMMNNSPFAILPGNHFKKILGWNSSGRRKDGRKFAFASHNSARLTYGLTAIFDLLCAKGMLGLLAIPLKMEEKRRRINNHAWIPSWWVVWQTSEM